MFCLSCKISSPPGSVFCTGGCGKSLGCRICHKGHRCSILARHCGECGSSQLSDPSRALGLGGVSRLLSWGGAIAAAYWALHHLVLIVMGVWHLAWWCVGTLFAWNQPYSGFCVRMVLDWVLLIWLVSLFLPKEKGSHLRQRLWATLIKAFHVSLQVARWSAAATYRLVEGAVESGFVREERDDRVLSLQVADVAAGWARSGGAATATTS